MKFGDIIDPPDPAQRCGWREMTRDQRAHACWLTLNAGWSIRRLGWGAASTGVVVVTGPRQAVSCSLVHWSANQTLSTIADRFGAEGWILACAATDQPDGVFPGETRKHIETGRQLWVVATEVFDDGVVVAFSTADPAVPRRCGGVLQSVPLPKWLEKTEAID